MATKNVKLAILRARHDTTVPYISDAACIAMMITNPARRSVLNYWEAVTDNYLQFDGGSLMPWVDILGTSCPKPDGVCSPFRPIG